MLTPEEVQMHADLAFTQWGLRLSKPTEPDCPGCMHPESRCACGYIQYRDTMMLVDWLRGER